MKRVLWLARDTDSDARLYRSRPKRETIKGRKAGPCGCAPGCTYIWREDQPTEISYSGPPLLTSFCSSGLSAAGIEIESGGLLKLTIEVEAK